MTLFKIPISTITRFFGSMNLAVTLLVVIAISSIIGTVLQQNQPYTGYQIKFGSFWFEIFRLLGLYDVYSTTWFLGILFFLVFSTSICVTRNTPGFLREIKQFRENIQEKSLLLMKNSQRLTVTQSADDLLQLSQKIFRAQGYQFRVKRDEQHTMIAARKGASHYWGYWLTHLGIIVILLGGLMDSRLPLMISEWQGNIKPETRTIPASEIPAISYLGEDTFSFRGSVDVAENQRANIIFISERDGYYVQRLPFEVEVKDFRVEHYSTGQPKSFESDLVIYDKDLEEPLKTTISVNHPLIYKGIAIYQASFGDGGSEVKLRFHPFDPSYIQQDLTGNVFQDYKMNHPEGGFQLEITEFRLFNIIPFKGEDGKDVQQNVGPSVTFKLRNAAGEAVEYINYMSPVPIQDKRYIVSGMRTKPSEPLRYLHIPLDRKGTAEGFLAFLRQLQNADFVRAAAKTTTKHSLSRANVSNTDIEQQVVESMVRLTKTFATRGFDGITADIAERFPEAQRDAVNQAFMKVLNAALRATFIESMQRQGIAETALTVEDWTFFDDSLSAIANLPFYYSPWYVQLMGFKQVEASGLQMARAPGKNVVYFGSLMLTIGVFLMFYVARRRIWIWIKPNIEQQQTEFILAGTSNRQAEEFNLFLEKVQQTLQQTSARS